MLSPALPDLPWGVATLIGVGIPMAALSQLPDRLDRSGPTHDPTRDETASDETAGERRRLGWFPVAFLLVGLGYFTTGLLGFTPTVINGISMEPGMHTGDLVVTQQVDADELDVGDVIRFRRGAGSIVHRITEVQVAADGEPMFITQGDNNPAPDSPVAADDVIGEVALHVPKVGLPVYWVRSLLS